MTVIGGIVLHLACGNQYIWGNIGGYVISYQHYAGDPNATTKVTFTIKPIQALITIIFGFLGSLMYKKMSIKTQLFIGSTIMLSSVLIASFVKTWWAFFIFYGVLFPVGIGINYWPPIIAAWEWFPDRKGLITGIILGSFGFASFIFNFIT